MTRRRPRRPDGRRRRGARRRRSRAAATRRRGSRCARAAPAANVAAWLARAGADGRARRRASATTPRPTSRWPALDGVDVRVERDPERPTGTCIVLVAARRRAHDAARPGRQRRASLRPARRRAQPATHLHVSGYALLRDGLARGARWRRWTRARDGGDDRLRRSRRRRAAADDPSVPRPRTPVDLLLPNEDEAAVLGGDARRRARSWSSSARAARRWSDGARRRARGCAGRGRRHDRRRRRVRRRLPQRTPRRRRAARGARGGRSGSPRAR